MSLHCIWSIQSSSIAAVPKSRFSAWHDKCLPASAFVAMKDKTLVVVFPSSEVCNNIMMTYIVAHIYIVFFFIATTNRPALSSAPIVLTCSPSPYIKHVSITRGSALTVVEILDQSLVTLFERMAYFLTMKDWLLPFLKIVPSLRQVLLNYSVYVWLISASDSINESTRIIDKILFFFFYKVVYITSSFSLSNILITY